MSVPARKKKKRFSRLSNTKSQLHIYQTSPKTVQIEKKKMRCSLPQVVLRHKSTNLLRQTSQLLFCMAVKEHQKKKIRVSKRKEKNPGSFKIFIQLSDIDQVCYIKLNSQFLFNLIKRLMSPDKFSSNKSSQMRRFQTFAVC